MIDLKILYNGLFDPRLIKYVSSVSIIDDIDKKSSSIQITLADVSGRFSRGSWAAFSGDVLSVELGGVKIGDYSITSIGVDTGARSVTWKGARRAVLSAPVKNPTKGKKPPYTGGALNVVLPLGMMKGTPAETAAAIASAAGLRLQISAPPPDGWSKPLEMSCFGQTGARALDDLCARSGARWSADAAAVFIYPGETAAAPRPAAPLVAAPRNAVSVIPIGRADLLGVASADSIAPAEVSATVWRPGKKRGEVQQAGGASAGVPIQTRTALADAAAAYKQIIADAASADLQIAPRPGIVAGCIIEVEGIRRQVVQMRYGRSAGAETMGLSTKGAK